MPTAEAVKTGKARRGELEETTLSTGYRARLTPVSAALIQDCISRVPDPKPPMWHNKETEMDEPNLVHPDYLQECAEVETKRAAAALDAVILFGIDLIDPPLDEEGWVKKLKYLAEKRGAIDLSEFDLDDEMDREFVFKRYVAIAADDYALVAKLSGVPQEEVMRAAKTFPGDETRGAPAGVPS